MIRSYLIFGAALAVGIMPAQGQDSFPLNIDYSTPEAVAEDFTNAMAEADFFRAYFLLSPEAKNAFQIVLASGRADTMFPGAEMFEYPSLTLSETSGQDVRDDIYLDGARTFDDMMAGALRDGELPFSFDNAEVGVLADDGDRRTAAIEGASDGLVLHLAETEWQEWRVDAVTWGDAGEAEPLWKAGADATALPSAQLPAPPRTFVDDIDYSSIEAVAEQFIAAMGAEDYFRAYFLIAPESKDALFNDPSGTAILTLVPGIDRENLPGTGLFRPNVERADALAFDTMRDPALIFHRVLTAAKAQGVLPFDLKGATIDSVDDVVRIVPANGEPLEMRMSQMSDGQWRIAQIMWPGSNENALPWGGNPSDALKN